MDSTPVSAIEASGGISANRLWLAYAIAPPIGVAIVGVAIGIFGFINQMSNPNDVDANPLAIILVPIFMVLVGAPFCYFVLGLFGMPILFYLRRKEKLTGGTVFATAMGLAMSPMLIAGFVGVIPSLLSGNSADVRVAMGTGLGFSLMTIPVALIVAFVFWLVGVRQTTSKHA